MSVPINALMVLKSRLLAAQPTVLKASVTPTACPPDLLALFTVASIAEVFCAASVTLPVVVTVSLVR